MRKSLLYTSTIAMLLSSAVTIKSNAQSWSLAGNAGTNPTTQFLGTTDSKFLKFRTNNAVRLTISSGGRVGIGNTNPLSRLDILGATTDSVSVVSILGKYSGKKQDVIGLLATSTPTDTTGIGVSGSGNFIGVEGSGNNFGVLGNGATGVYGYSNYGTSAGFPTGVWGESAGGTQGNGVFGYAATGTQQNIAIWGIATDTVNNGTSANTDFAGFFQGNIGYWRAFNISDAKFKKNIEPLNGALDKIKKLTTASYTFKRDEYPKLYLPQGQQIGFLADNMESVFPQFVIKNSLPAKINPKTHEVISQAADLKMVDYISMIPVLTAGIQEQQVQIENKDAQINTLNSKLANLESRLAALEATSVVQNNRTGNAINETAASLEQNNPNPFTQSTQIRYALPSDFKSAQIIITAPNGNVMKNYSIKSKGLGQLTVNANELAAGIYTYSLLVDGNIVSTKSLVLTK